MMLYKQMDTWSIYTFLRLELMIGRYKMALNIETRQFKLRLDKHM